MHPFNTSFLELLKRDKRYKAEAYIFVYETLTYAQNVLKLGKTAKNEPLDGKLPPEWEPNDESGNHITGQDLCWAARDYAVLQYGPLAKTVLNSVGIHKTDDIGAVVYNLINIHLMRKTQEDSQDDFNGVFDFDTVFSEPYQIKIGNEKS